MKIVNALKYGVTTSLLLVASTSISQNIKDQKVSFKYIQLPIKPLNKSIATYTLNVDKTGLEKNNQDSTDVYDSKLLLWQANFDTWLEAKQKIDKAFLLELAKHEKAINAGGNMVLPTRPAYPKQPILAEIKQPILTEDVAINNVNVKLDGYVIGNDGAIVTVELLGLRDAKIIEKKSGSGATTKYVYTSQCKYPIHIKIESAINGVVVDEVIGDSLLTDVFKTKYTSKYDYQYWAVDNLKQYWIDRQKVVLNKNIELANKIVNDYCGYSLRTRDTEIYTVKKHKNHSYSDFIDAYTNANSGYAALQKDRNHASAKPKILKAISTWESALSESNPSNNKARINKKITALLYVNLAEAYMWIDDFDSAENYRLKAEQAGVLKYKMAAKKLEKLMVVAKERYQINN